MRAIDTNVVVRVLTGDDPVQSPRARAILDAGDVFVPLTVILETEWVLRSIFRYGTAEVVRALRTLGGLPGVSVEHAGRLDVALERAEAGMDFADALHLAAAEDCEAILTFDRPFLSAARAAGLGRVLDAAP